MSEIPGYLFLTNFKKMGLIIKEIQIFKDSFLQNPVQKSVFPLFSLTLNFQMPVACETLELENEKVLQPGKIDL